MLWQCVASRRAMHLVDGDRRTVRLKLRAARHPLSVAPRMRRDVPDLRGGAGRMLRAEGVRIGLVEPVAVDALDAVLVAVAGPRVLDRSQPAAGAVVAAMQRLAVPAVDRADR